MYLSVIGIAYWSNRQAKKLKEKDEDGLQNSRS